MGRSLLSSLVSSLVAILVLGCVAREARAQLPASAPSVAPRSSKPAVARTETTVTVRRGWFKSKETTVREGRQTTRTLEREDVGVYRLKRSGAAVASSRSP